MNWIFFYLKRFFLSAIFLVIGVIVFSQLNGDYRSKQNGFWHDPASWEKFNGTTWVNAPTAPTSSDGQIAVLNGHTITTSSVGGDIAADQVTVNVGGVLTLTNTLNLANGTGDDLTLNGTMNFNGGQLNGPGNTIIQPGGVLNFTTTDFKSIGSPITNNGTMNWQGGTITMIASVTLINNAAFSITANDLLGNNGGIQAVLVNNGTITKTGGGQSSFNIAINNAGTINLNAGTFRNTGTFTNTGQITFNTGTFLNDLFAPFNFNTGSVITGTGSFDNRGALTLNTGIVFPSTIPLIIGSHTSDISGSGSLTINNDFTMQGIIQGAGTLIINGNITWNSGTISRGLTVDAGRSLSFATTEIKLIGAALTNNGTMNWQEGGIFYNSDVSITNNNQFLINSNSQLSNNGLAHGTLINNSIITKTSTGITTISITNLTNNNNAVIKGVGTISLAFSVTMTNNGIIAPGLSPGILTLNGGNPFSAASTLSIEIAGNGGAGQPTGHDQLQRVGDLALNGNLTVVQTGTIPDGDYTIILLSAGTISGTFSSANLPANYSVIYNANNVVVRKGTVCPPSVSISANPAGAICAGTNVTFTATPVNGGTPGYQWKLNGNNVGTNSNTYQNSTLTNGDVVTVVMTSSLGCASPTTAAASGITMTVNPSSTPSVSISANPGNSICSGTNVTFTATPTNGGATPTYQWKLNGNNVGTNSNTYQNASLINGDVVTVVVTSSIACAAPNPVTSNGITLIVSGNVTPSVSIAANPGNTICSGINVTFTATPTNGGTPSYQWKLNGNNVGTNSNTYQNASLVNGDVVTVVMTSSITCANPTTATSNGITMVVTGSIAPSVSIAANPGNTICAGTNVTFTATPTNGGIPSYQWKLNGNNVGTNSNTYQNASLANGDVVTVVMTSSLACASPVTATSNAITMTVNPTVTPSVSIAANPGSTICTGTNVTFTATPTNGGTPSYQWKLNGNNVGTNSNSYQNSALVNGDVVTVVMTSTLACASPATATSNAITMIVSGNVTPSVSVLANPGSTICTGTNVTFTATPTNGGTPFYQWKVNGNNVGTNSNTYQNASLANGDVVTVVMTSSLACASPATATSNTITMTVSGNVTPSVSISASPGNTICAGTNVTFTATPTNGGTPSYQWKLNGNNVGSSSNTYQNSTLVNGDAVTVVMTSSLACASPTTATSNAINMVVTATVTPSVSIVANPGNTICAGTNVTFTATPTNGGTPSYQWKLNGNNVGTNSNIYQNASLVNENVITVVMTSTATCASPTTATSNAVTMTVTTLSTFYIDADGDGFGNATVSQQACSAPNGYVANNTDCDDNNAAVHPGAAEICGNGIDDNCNDQTDENCTADLPTIITRTYPVKEGDAGNTVLEVEVRLDRPAPLQVEVNYATSNDDAIAGSDYVATQGVLIIPAGATSGIIRVSIKGDLIPENSERFWLNFSNPVNVIIDGDGRSRIMIIDDDKGKPTVRAENDTQREQLPGLNISNVASRNHIWTITGISEMPNEVTIVNLQGQVIFRANNYRNNIPIGNVSIGLYVYQIRVMEKDNKVKFYTGKLLVTE